MVIQVSPIDAHHAALDSLTFHSYMVAEVTPTAFSTIGWRYFVVFACTNLFLILPCKSPTNAATLKSDLTLLVGVYLFFPETNGLHLEEVDQIFRESKNIFQPAQVARGLPRRALLDRDRESIKGGVEMMELKD